MVTGGFGADQSRLIGHFVVFRVQNASWKYSSEKAQDTPDGVPCWIRECVGSLDEDVHPQNLQQFPEIHVECAGQGLEAGARSIERLKCVGQSGCWLGARWI